MNRNFPEKEAIYVLQKSRDSNSYNLIYFSYLGKDLELIQISRVINNIILTVEPSVFADVTIKTW